MSKQKYEMPYAVAMIVKEWYDGSREVDFPGTQRLQGRFREIRGYPTVLLAVIKLIGREALQKSEHGRFIRAEVADRLYAEARAVLGSHDSGYSDGPAHEGVQPHPLDHSEGNVQRKKPKSRAGKRWKLCDEVLLKAELAAATAKSERKHLLEVLAARPCRALPRVTKAKLAALCQLKIDFPNFSTVIDQVETDLRLARFVGDAIHIKPMLLLGPPGAGKTEFMRRMAAVLSMKFAFSSGAEVTVGWTFSGMSSGFQNAIPGLVAKEILALPDGQALLLAVDEIDKVEKGRVMSLDKTLLGLLEPGSARAFKDEFLGLPLDTRPVSWMLTANRIEDIKPELLSRLRVFEIAQPSRDEMPAVVRSIDAALRRDQPKLASRFAPLSDELIRFAGQQAPRAIHRQLHGAYANAVRELGDERLRRGQRITLRPDHLQRSGTAIQKHKAPMGFLN